MTCNKLLTTRHNCGLSLHQAAWALQHDTSRCSGLSGCHGIRRALHATGTSSLEQAVNWLVEHGEDADIDTPLLIPKVHRNTQL